MQTIITSKFQTTIPKKIREKLRLSISDALEWSIEGEKIVMTPIHDNFLSFQNSVKVGKGNIDEDIKVTRKFRGKKYL